MGTDTQELIVDREFSSQRACAERVLQQEQRTAEAIAATAIALRSELGALILELGFTNEEVQDMEVTAEHKDRARCLRNDAFCRETVESIMSEYGGFRACDDNDSRAFETLLKEFLAVVRV